MGKGLAVDNRPIVVSPAEVGLAEEPLDPSSILEGDPRTSDGEIARVGSLVTGVWTCTPGRMTDVEADETFVVLEGRATIEAEDEEPVDVGPGDVCVLAAGTRTTWTVHEPLRKVYVIREG